MSNEIAKVNMEFFLDLIVLGMYSVRIYNLSILSIYSISVAAKLDVTDTMIPRTHCALDIELGIKEV